MRDRPNLLIAFPRSGTDWFCGAINVNPSIRYFREYFNPLCNPAKAPTLSLCFGDETLEHYHSIMADRPRSEIEPIVWRTWADDKFNTTKENYLAIKAEYFVDRFDTICLIRNLSHTFPTSRPEYIVPILSSFMASGGYQNSFLARQLNELRSFVSHIQIRGIHEAGVMAYLVHHYLLLAVCRTFRVPIVTYESLMVEPASTLETRLACLDRFEIDVPLTVKRLIETRAESGDTMLARRRKSFHDLPAIPWIERTVRFLGDLSPEFGPDIESYLVPA